MVTKESKLGLGGSCHWCTEAVFLSLREPQKSKYLSKTRLL